MIRPEQLVAALERLDPRDRELLALSLRRRVPDEALGRVYDCEPADVARRRAAAIDRLADDLGAQRGEDLGSVLKALLEPETWATVDSGRAVSGPVPGDEFGARRSMRPEAEPEEEEDGETPPEHEPRVYRIGTPVEDEARSETDEPASATAATNGDVAAGRLAPSPEASAESADATVAEAASTASSPLVAPADDAPVVSPAAIPDPAAPQPVAEAFVRSAASPENGATPDHRMDDPPPASDAPPGSPRTKPEPVLEMLAGDRPSTRVATPERRPPRTMVLVGLGIAAFAALAGFVGAKEFGGGGNGTQGGDGGEVRHFTPQERGPLGAAPFPSDPQSGSCYPTAYVRRKTTLYREPGGRRLITVAARTEWSSPRVLGVESQREGWLAVTVPELPNGEVGWIQRSQARVDCVRWSLHVDLSRRLIYVRKDGHTVRTLHVAIGSAEHPTPQGRFAVTDRLRVADKSSPYGCCVLALSGHQTKLPDDWPGGDRLAVHATTDIGSIGRPVSLGCMRATSNQVRWLIETIPLGSPIFIRS